MAGLGDQGAVSIAVLFFQYLLIACRLLPCPDTSVPKDGRRHHEHSATAHLFQRDVHEITSSSSVASIVLHCVQLKYASPPTVAASTPEQRHVQIAWSRKQSMREISLAASRSTEILILFGTVLDALDTVAENPSSDQRSHFQFSCHPTKLSAARQSGPPDCTHKKARHCRAFLMGMDLRPWNGRQLR